VAEHRQQSVALDGSDMTLVPIDDLAHLIAVAVDQRVIRLRFQAGGQRRRVDKVGEKNCQAPDFAVASRRGKQILGVGVAAVDRQDLPGQRRGRRAVSLVDGPHRAVQQVVDRRAALTCILLTGMG
jgi:hypothetical protein